MKSVAMTALVLVLALFVTVFQGDTGQCQSRTQQGTYVDGRDAAGETSLFNASRIGDESPVKLLLKSGASSYGVDGTAETGLTVGAENRHVRIVWALRLPVAPPSLDSQKMESSTEAGKILSRRGACRMTSVIQAISRGPPQYETRAPLRRASANSALS